MSIWSCAWQNWIFWKKNLPQKLGKWTKNGPVKGFLNLLKKLDINFYWTYSIMKICIICCVPAQIPYLGKFLLPRYEPKRSQPIRWQDFFNQPYLQSKSMILLDFLHVDTNSHKIKVTKYFWGGHGQKWVWPVVSQDSKIDCTSKMNKWNKLIFCKLV